MNFKEIFFGVIKSSFWDYLLMEIKGNCFLDDGEKNIYTGWYMTDHDRNVRTLIVSFVLALSVLIPLRLMQTGSNVSLRESNVLGEVEVIEGDKMELIYGDEIDQDSEVILPDAEVPVEIETEEE